MSFCRYSVLITLATCFAGTAAAVGCGSDPVSVAPSGDAGTFTDSGPAATFSVSAAVVGFKGSGLVLQDKSGVTIPVTAQPNGATQTVVILSKVPAQTAFDVSIKTQPGGPAQTCVVAGGKGVVVAGDVTSITVNCTDLYTVGGTVIGLDGKDLIVENTSGTTTDSLTINMNGQFAFPTPLLAGSTYAVSVKQNPTANWQTCTVSSAPSDAGADGGGAGGGISGNVTDLVVNCVTNEYPISVKVTGLDLASTGVVFQNAGADYLLVKTNATVPFATPIASGANYDVKVLTQPTAPWQTCVVTAGGPAKVTSAGVLVGVACTTNQYKIGGTLAGLTGNGLVLQNNLGDDLTLNAANNGAFNFATSLPSGSTYAVSIKTQPSGTAGELCSLTTPSGGVASADITSVGVNCLANPFVGSILTSGAQGSQVNTWIGAPGQVWKLCYRLSKDGASTATFHQNCDNKGASVTFALLNANQATERLIGGYGATAWNGALANYQANASSFLFSLTNGFKHASGGIGGNNNYEQYSNSTYGPTFGGGHDFLSGLSNTVGNSSYCNIGYTYACRVGAYATAQCRADFCGVYSPVVSDLEVFTK